jgi:hypothetical protein
MVRGTSGIGTRAILASTLRIRTKLGHSHRNPITRIDFDYSGRNRENNAPKAQLLR